MGNTSISVLYHSDTLSLSLSKTTINQTRTVIAADEPGLDRAPALSGLGLPPQELGS